MAPDRRPARRWAATFPSQSRIARSCRLARAVATTATQAARRDLPHHAERERTCVASEHTERGGEGERGRGAEGEGVPGREDAVTRIMRFCWTTSLGLTIITKFLLSLIASRPLTVCSRCRSLCLGLSASLAWPQESSSVLKQVIRTLFVSLSLSPYSGRLRLTCICLINHPSCSHAPHRAHRLHRGTYSCTQSDNACAFHSPSCPRARFPGAKLDRGIQRRLLARLGCRVSRRFWFTRFKTSLRRLHWSALLDVPLISLSLGECLLARRGGARGCWARVFFPPDSTAGGDGGGEHLAGA